MQYLKYAGTLENRFLLVRNLFSKRLAYSFAKVLGGNLRKLCTQDTGREQLLDLSNCLLAFSNTHWVQKVTRAWLHNCARGTIA